MSWPGKFSVNSFAASESCSSASTGHNGLFVAILCYAGDVHVHLDALHTTMGNVDSCISVYRQALNILLTAVQY